MFPQTGSNNNPRPLSANKYEDAYQDLAAKRDPAPVYEDLKGKSSSNVGEQDEDYNYIDVHNISKDSEYSYAYSSQISPIKNGNTPTYYADNLQQPGTSQSDPVYNVLEDPNSGAQTAGVVTAAAGDESEYLELESSNPGGGSHHLVEEKPEDSYQHIPNANVSLAGGEDEYQHLHRDGGL